MIKHFCITSFTFMNPVINIMIKILIDLITLTVYQKEVYLLSYIYSWYILEIADIVNDFFLI